MGDGRFDDARLLDVAEKNARARILFDMESVAKEAGAMINAVMLGAIAGCGKLPIPVEAFEARDPRRRQGGGGKPARLPRRTCRPRAPKPRHSRRATEGKRREKPRNDLAIAREREIAQTMPAVGAGHRDRRRAPAAALPGRHLRAAAISTGSRRSATLDAQMRRRRQTAARDRAAPRGAHVVRGPDPRGAGEDRSGAHAAHRAGTGRRQRRALSASPNFSSPASRKCARCCRRAGAPHHRLFRKARLAR